MLHHVLLDNKIQISFILCLQTSSDPLSPSDTDEEPVAKLPKLTDSPRDPKLCSDSEEYLDAKGSDVSEPETTASLDFIATNIPLSG